MQAREAVAPIYRQIADDVKRACEQEDRARFSVLTGLVVALDRAYPEEMAALRGEGLPPVLSLDPPCSP